MITTISELKRFRDNARALCGSPSVPVCHLGFRWKNPRAGNLMDYIGDDLLASFWGDGFNLLLGHRFPLLVPLKVGKPVYLNAQDSLMESWGSVRIPSVHAMTGTDKSVWAIEPSILTHGVIHAYCLIYDVPLHFETGVPPWGE